MTCALITGATSGIGEALAKLLTSKGMDLIISGRNSQRLDSVAQQVNAKMAIAVDLQNREERKKLVQIIRDQVPDLIINNAGFGRYGDPLSLSVEEQLSILEVNAAAALELTLEGIQALVRAKKNGIIMNISSVAGEFPCPGMSVYGASKAFLTHVSQALNTEVSSKGVFVLASCPGMVDTDFANRAAKKEIRSKEGPVISSEVAAEQIWKQIETKKEKYIFSWHYRLGMWFAAHFAPTSLIKSIIWKKIKKRI